MKVLWITHDVLDMFLPHVKGRPTRGGSWIDPLFFSLATTDITLGILTPVIDGENIHISLQEIDFYSVGIKEGGNIVPMNNSVVDNYKWAIKHFNPDIIHIHGVEKNFGLITKFLNKDIPVVCSIQGLITSYEPYLKVSIANFNYKRFRSIKNFLGRGGTANFLSRWRKYIPIETEIIRKNNYFIGRTLWDKAQILALNPSACYFHGEELLRDEFYRSRWNLESCVRHTIFASSSAYPIKGFHLLLQAVAILKRKYPNVKVITPLSSFTLDSPGFKDFLLAEDYGRFLRSEIDRLDLKENVVLLKRLSASEMTEQYLLANVFALPSFIENSPNSMGEAMMIGTPVVSANVGGVMSMVKDGDSALLFPSGDYATLAYQIDRVFSDDSLANSLCEEGKKVALQRHDVEMTTIQYREIYHTIKTNHHDSSPSI